MVGAKVIGKWMLMAMLPLFFVAGALFYFGQGLQDASLDNFDITGIDDITTESFTILGNLYVINPSDLSVPIESITYQIILKESGEMIGEGDLPAFTLEEEKTSKIPFHQEIAWVPTAELAADLLIKEEVIVEVVGELRINLPKVKEYAIPFSQETDIKAYIQQFGSNPTDSLLPIDDSIDRPLDESDDPTEEDPDELFVPLLG